jgi:hypothetical protein
MVWASICSWAELCLIRETCIRKDFVDRLMVDSFEVSVAI